jgi:hypothetical protein
MAALLYPGFAGSTVPSPAARGLATRHESPRAGESRFPRRGNYSAGGKSETSRRRDNLNLAGCRAGNIAPRSWSARNPPRARLHCARPRHRNPETQNPPRRAGLHTGRGRELDYLAITSFPYLADFRKPLWRAPVRCAQSQPLPGGCTAPRRPDACLCPPHL